MPFLVFNDTEEYPDEGIKVSNPTEVNDDDEEEEEEIPRTHR